MNLAQRSNLDRLFTPRHIAVFGGRDAEVVIGECERIGFSGKIWPVNPKRQSIGGYPCYASIDDLPEAPDAAYMAIPRDAALEAVERLAAIGTGGVVCYSAGFAETGPDGQKAEDALVLAAGDMALIGPNCYGLINYIDRVALWPFAHGGASPGYGAAIITQSGMLSSDITMSQRSLPFAYMVSAGNQAALRLEDFIDYLADKPEVRAIGLHIEGLKDIEQFSKAARRALKAGIPIVALKTGSSAIGAELTISHTGSLSGTDDLYQALFDKLGIIRVPNPAQLLETLKFFCVAGPTTGHSIAGITCSGGGATMLADHGEKISLSFPAPRQKTARILRERLPDIATVSNPLDYTTKIWGQGDKVRAAFDALLDDPYDAAILVQDYPLPGLDESKQLYLNDAVAFVEATRARNLPAAVCSTLPENLDKDTRDFLISQGVAPLQGIDEALNALWGAGAYGRSRERILASDSAFIPVLSPPFECVPLNEWQAKDILKKADIPTPESALVAGEDVVEAAARLGFPVALKMVGEDLVHKTEVGAVRIGLRDEADVNRALVDMRDSVGKAAPQALRDQFLVERMVEGSLAELLISVRNDPSFGLAMTLASGGVFVELLDDARTILLPTDETEILKNLNELKIANLLNGFRGAPVVDKALVSKSLVNLAVFATDNRDTIAEIEINPLFILPGGTCAVDVLMQVKPGSANLTFSA
jgi:acyl-CoA synthetase (NDP forming)